jgi:hypothetical protein
MTSITTRAGKGTPLTHTEVDDNFTNLNADKLEASNNLSDVSSASAARTNLGLGTAATTASTAYATAAQGSLADSALQSGDNVSALTNDAGYTANVGDITGVTAGSGITGGGTSGTVTINHADTSSQGSVNNSGTTVIQDITLDTYGHITALGSTTLSIPAAYTNSDVDTHLNTGTATTDQVLSWNGSDYDWIDAGGGGSTTAGDVGTYAFLISASTWDFTFGSTLAGSSLRPSGITTKTSSSSLTNPATAGNITVQNTTQAGTWRCMGRADYNAVGGRDTTYYRPSTLWVRIS